MEPMTDFEDWKVYKIIVADMGKPVFVEYHWL